jgi:hypothetical protein
MLRLAALVLSAWVLLSGCTEPIYSYSKPGATLMDWKQDSYSCVQEPGTLAGGTGLVSVGAATNNRRETSRLYKMCMEARGWTAN